MLMLRNAPFRGVTSTHLYFCSTSSPKEVGKSRTNGISFQLDHGGGTESSFCGREEEEEEELERNGKQREEEKLVARDEENLNILPVAEENTVIAFQNLY